MKKLYSILTIFSMILVLYSIHLASAEVTLWRETIVNKNTSILRLHGYYQFYDESKDFIGKSRPVPVAISYSWDNFPYNISNYYPQYQNALVDYCNFTAVHGKYDYNSAGEVTGYSEKVYNHQIENINASYNITIFQLKHNDNLVIDMDCHYTNPQTLYIDGVHFADWGTWFTAFTCTGCEDTKLEELAKETEYNMIQAEKEIEIYKKIQSVVTINYQVWVYGSWIIKIALVIGSVFLIFGVGYFFYTLLTSLARL